MASDLGTKQGGDTRTKPVYCAVCTLPVEFCEFQPSFDKCKAALVKNWTTSYPGVTDDDEITALMTKLGFVGEPDDAAKKARGTKKAADKPDDAPPAAGAPAAEDGQAGGGVKKKKGGKDVAQVVISIAQRNRRKHITSVVGLDAYGVKLSDASKAFGKKFASGASIVKGQGALPDAIEIQGELKEPLAELIAELFGVPRDAIFCLEGGKKEPMF